MISAWLDLPWAGIFAVLIALYGVTGVLIVWAAFGRPFGARVRQLEGLVGPYFGAIGILLALLTGFLAGDIADRNRQAMRAVETEAGELRNVYIAASDMRAIRAAWTGYLKAAIADDWPAMAQGEGAPSADGAYDELLREASDPKIATEAGAAVHAALLNATVRVGTARSERLALSSYDVTSSLKWAIVLALGVLTQLAIGLVHLQRRPAHIAAIAVFSVAVVITLGLLALQEHPFAGEIHIGLDPLQQLLAQMTAKGG
ncbi:MAG TPA: hypothetical protein VMI47_05985 [Pseudolabrys sp.]|nr:hypothetical protein [Pseudolabrys sp.]